MLRAFLHSSLMFHVLHFSVWSHADLFLNATTSVQAWSCPSCTIGNLLLKWHCWKKGPDSVQLLAKSLIPERHKYPEGKVKSVHISSYRILHITLIILIILEMFHYYKGFNRGIFVIIKRDNTTRIQSPLMRVAFNTKNLKRQITVYTILDVPGKKN